MLLSKQFFWYTTTHMIITYHGKQFIRMQLGDLIVALNPSAEPATKGAKPTRFGADVAICSMVHPEFHAVDAVTYGDKTPFVIDGPGSYEVRGMTVQGKLTPVHKDNEPYMNTVYFFTFDDMEICVLGHLSTPQLSTEVREAIGDVDVLVLSLNESGLNPHEAHKLALSFEPKIILPVDYTEKTLQMFLKEVGSADVSPVEKITLKKKDCIGKNAEIIVIQP
jgi:hypothetical protein